MAFYVGQKVVCVDARSFGDCEWGETETPKQGAIYTVQSVHNDNYGKPVLWLHELSRDAESQEDHGHLIGYGVWRFRPITERKTSIEIFKAMLNPSKTEVEA